MQKVSEIAECEKVRNSIFLVRKYIKLENQMKGCAVELKVSDLQMSTCTSWVCDTAKGRRGISKCATVQYTAPRSLLKPIPRRTL